MIFRLEPLAENAGDPFLGGGGGGGAPFISRRRRLPSAPVPSGVRGAPASRPRRARRVSEVAVGLVDGLVFFFSPGLDRWQVEEKKRSAGFENNVLATAWEVWRRGSALALPRGAFHFGLPRGLRRIFTVGAQGLSWSFTAPALLGLMGRADVLRALDLQCGFYPGPWELVWKLLRWPGRQNCQWRGDGPRFFIDDFDRFLMLAGNNITVIGMEK